MNNQTKKQTYVITRDIVETLEGKLSINLTRSIKCKIKGLESEFLSEFWPFVPSEYGKLALETSDLRVQLSCAMSNRDLPVISLDRVYLPNAQGYLEVTRLTNPKTGIVSLGPRPGTPELTKQIDALAKYKRIILADVGAFTGDTLLELCDRVETKGIKVEEVLLGLSSVSASQRTNSVRKVTALNEYIFYEWLELRDLFGIDGRNVGFENGSRLYIPYSENLTEWASIPKEFERDVANLCRNFYQKLIGCLKQQEIDTKKIGNPIRYMGD